MLDYRRHAWRYALAGLLGVILGLFAIALRASLGASVAFPLRVALVPIELPFLLSMQFSLLVWDDPLTDLYRHICFSMPVYFCVGVAVYGGFRLVHRKVFYGIVGVALAAVIASGIVWKVRENGGPTQVDDFHVVQRGWARMPLWVKGNAASGVMILFLHGGPGDNAIEKHLCDAFRKLEHDFAVVYWDQRASGNSTGRPADAVATLDERVDDLRHVIDYCQKQYHPQALFLMGHSAGGELGTKYLIDAAGEQPIAGWIEVDGSHNEPLGWELSIEWLRKRAGQRIKTAKNSDERKFWQQALDYATNHTQREPWYETEFWDKYIGPAGGYDFGAGPQSSDYRREFHYIFSRASYFTERINLMHSKQVFRDALAADYTPQMERITVPALLLWGEHDGAVPVALARDAYDALGTRPEHKRVVKFAKSAHNPMNEEPDKFYREVKVFIDRYAKTTAMQENPTPNSDQEVATGG